MIESPGPSRDVMEDCFCGCGQTLPSTHESNQIGRAVVEAIGDIERNVIPPLRERKQTLPLPEWNPALSMVERLLVAGRRHESLCRALAHGQDPEGVDWSVVTRWVDKASRMADAFRRPPNQRPKRVWDLPAERRQAS